WLVRVERFRPTADATATQGVDAEPVAVAVDESGQLALFVELPTGPARVGLELPALEPLPSPPVHVPRRLSYSAIALYERCSYRYYAERVLGLRSADAPIAGGAEGLAATEIGDAAHRLLELVPLHAPVAPARADLAATVRSWYPTVRDDELERIAAFVDAYCESSLAARVAAMQGIEPERPFAFAQDGVLIHGRLDALWLDGGRAFVLDYKTNQLFERTPVEVVEQSYRLQRVVYALACLRGGIDEVEVAYQFLEQAEDVVTETFSRDDVLALEAELSAAITRIRSGDFRPMPSEFACSGCPALDVVCAGPRLGGYAGDDDQWGSMNGHG
ncbi:MAG: PD-(D/E)XK nuclease family protein, partial [Gaiellaceae bacterium]